MSLNEPLILSICVPTYNRQFLLERNVTFHLDAFRRIGIPFEIVIVDDCSTDDTAAYIASLADQPEISAFRRATNSGFLSNYAFAMQRAAVAMLCFSAMMTCSFRKRSSNIFG